MVDTSKPYFNSDMVKALRLLCKPNKLGVSLVGKKIFYPGSFIDYTLNKALGDKAVIYNNDLKGILTDEFVSKYSGIRGDCRDVFKSLDYDTLFLNDVHVLTHELVNKASLVLTCCEGNFVHNVGHDYLRGFDLVGVIIDRGNDFFIDTESLSDYTSFPSDDAIRSMGNYKARFNEFFSDLKDECNFSDVFLSDLLKMSEDETLVDLVKSNYDNLEEFMSDRFSVSDVKSWLLLSDALYLDKNDFINKIKEYQRIKLLSDDDLLVRADFRAISVFKNIFSGDNYLKNGLLYVYSKRL